MSGPEPVRLSARVRLKAPRERARSRPWVRVDLEPDEDRSRWPEQYRALTGKRTPGGRTRGRGGRFRKPGDMFIVRCIGVLQADTPTRRNPRLPVTSSFPRQSLAWKLANQLDETVGIVVEAWGKRAGRPRRVKP